ncbi:hypothetical protein PF005_g17221 [Phytophthora fragariae]|uniref:Uncharacterized protein n=2 Tax=Phytophthora TaxID=4783 RepID=A0A6A3RH06_9STRA|nr:hypothetical protein PF003_g30659 [Phytophthora fragariae]KAE9016956.1 hypothetical protein PR002_g13529 [Phytophthora rubi]KAE8931519.1 hypothetical protein PF009_g18419 [Phytophthora fragariae]KAE8995907.1 hypothetical protein PF011_g16128 [Phytophthora fragariae]KAE9022278.1 hypothetical protein PR001_g13181 [Phytophthora rubi]
MMGMCVASPVLAAAGAARLKRKATSRLLLERDRHTYHQHCQCHCCPAALRLASCGDRFLEGGPSHSHCVDARFSPQRC